MDSIFNDAEDVRMMEFIIRQWNKTMNANMERTLVKAKEYKSKKMQYGTQIAFWQQATDIIKRHGYKKAKDVLMKGFEIEEPPKKLGYYLNKREECDEKFGEATWKKHMEGLIKYLKKNKKEYAHGEKMHVHAWNLDLENVEKYHKKISENDIEGLEHMTERDNAGKDVVVGVEDFKAETFKDLGRTTPPQNIRDEYKSGEGIRQLGKLIKSNYIYRESVIKFVKERKEYLKDPIEFYSKLHAKLKAEQ